ncbi:uracil-DNA glycosylase, partial [Colletotrichum sp. SAR 10_76]
APTNRRQGRPLRTQGPGSGVGARPVGVQVRGDVQEVHPSPEGARGLPERDWQHL